MAQIFHLCVIEVTLVEPTEELLCLQNLEYFTQVFKMVFWRLTVDENVIQVNQDALPYLLGKILFMSVWNTAGAFARPNGKTLNS